MQNSEVVDLTQSPPEVGESTPPDVAERASLCDAQPDPPAARPEARVSPPRLGGVLPKALFEAGSGAGAGAIAGTGSAAGREEEASESEEEAAGEEEAGDGQEERGDGGAAPGRAKGGRAAQPSGMHITLVQSGEIGSVCSFTNLAEYITSTGASRGWYYRIIRLADANDTLGLKMSDALELRHIKPSKQDDIYIMYAHSRPSVNGQCISLVADDSRRKNLATVKFNTFAKVFEGVRLRVLVLAFCQSVDMLQYLKEEVKGFNADYIVFFGTGTETEEEGSSLAFICEFVEEFLYYLLRHPKHDPQRAFQDAYVHLGEDFYPTCPDTYKKDLVGDYEYCKFHHGRAYSEGKLSAGLTDNFDYPGCVGMVLPDGAREDVKPLDIKRELLLAKLEDKAKKGGAKPSKAVSKRGQKQVDKDEKPSPDSEKAAARPAARRK